MPYYLRVQSRFEFQINQEETKNGAYFQKTKCLKVHCVRGQSGFFYLALTEVNMQIEFDWKLSVYSLGLDI